MTSITHQLVALLAAFWLLLLYPQSVGLVVGVFSLMAVMIGALTPDLDQPAANLWRRQLYGRAVGWVTNFLSGGHRHFTHSLLGIAVIGYLLWLGIHSFFKPQYVASLLVVWRAFMIGYISHPIADTLTDRGVPWLWPINFSIKIPPGPEELRVTTESFVEMILVRGALVVAIGFLLYGHWDILAAFFS
ncbi:MAG: metal-dependent hydrolase [Candidatus Sungbacteria bacterium]|nr:metal-dependent hydrolase [Candidatus Sungbacteria bacterium]